MKIFKIVVIILNLIVLINTLYFGLTAVLPFLMKEKRRDVKQKKKHKFLILIAARNEEKVIGHLIDSLKKQNYPKDLYKICVIPNNTTDNTKEIAIQKRCMVIEPDCATKTKGEVLNFAIEYFKGDDTFDTYAIFDADNVVDKDFLLEMNKKLNEGYKIIQGFRDTKNLYENCITGSYAIFFHTQNLFIYTSRERIGESSTINGTGFVVLKEYIDKINYCLSTSTEDIELTCISHIEGEKIGYCRNAIFYDEQVVDFQTSIRQRKRWVQGMFQVFYKYKGELFKKIYLKRNFDNIDMLQMLFFPINQVMTFIVVILTYIYILNIRQILLGIIIAYLGQVVFSIFILIFYKKNVRKLISSCLFFPIFNLCWLPLYFYSIFNCNNTWEEIKHTRALKIEEMTK